MVSEGNSNSLNVVNCVSNNRLIMFPKSRVTCILVSQTDIEIDTSRTFSRDEQQIRLSERAVSVVIEACGLLIA